MTGFGTGRAIDEDRSFTCEVRSVNHKYCDVRLRLPKELQAFEAQAQSIVRSRVARGRIDLSLEVDAAPGSTPRPEIDESLARAYFEGLRSLGQSLGLSSEPGIDLLASLPGVVRAPDRRLDLARFEATLARVVQAALDELDLMRKREGEALAQELRRLLEGVEAGVEAILRELPVANRERKERLEARLRDLLDGQAGDPVRIAQEVAILVDKSDVTEEVARLRSHAEQFERLLGAPEPVGRKLDFLIQEMHRETNTVGSKSGSVPLSHLVVDLKSALERMREQVQNVE